MEGIGKYIFFVFVTNSVYKHVRLTSGTKGGIGGLKIRSFTGNFCKQGKVRFQLFVPKHSMCMTF